MYTKNQTQKKINCFERKFMVQIYVGSQNNSFSIVKSGKKMEQISFTTIKNDRYSTILIKIFEQFFFILFFVKLLFWYCCWWKWWWWWWWWCKSESKLVFYFGNCFYWDICEAFFFVFEKKIRDVIHWFWWTTYRQQKLQTHFYTRKHT